MSESNRKQKKKRASLPLPDSTGFAGLCTILGVIFTYLTRCVIVQRTGLQGSGYFFAAYEVLVVCLLFFPLGVSETLREEFGQRMESGFYRNAKRVFNAAVVSVFLYMIFVLILWSQLSETIAGVFLLGKTNILPLLWLLPVFILDVLTLLLRGYLDGEQEVSAIGVVFLLRQVATFLFVLIFAGTFREEGANVSGLFRNEEVQYVYGAAGVAIGFLVGSAVGLLACLAIYFRKLSLLQRLVDRDPNRRRENSNAVLVTYAAKAALAYLGIHSMTFLAQLISMAHFREEAKLVQSYQWGILQGICRTQSFLPLFLVFLLHLGSAKAITRAMTLGDSHEVRIKCQNLAGVSMLLVCFFAAFSAAAATPVTKGLFGTDSVLAVRLLRISSLVMIATAYAFITCLELLFMQFKSRVALHAFAAVIAGCLLLKLLLPSDRLGIYAVFPAVLVFSLILTLLNLMVLNRKIRFRADIRNHVLWPVVFGVISGAVALLLSLLFGLFLPSVLAVIIVMPLSFITYYIAGCKMGIITEYTFYNIPFGDSLERLGRMLRVL